MTEIDLAGERLTLRSDGSLLSGQVLFVADLHLGKDAVFRSEGVAVPEGSSAETLDRLSAAILATDVRSLVLLGDVWHAEAGLTPGLLSQLVRWRAMHSALTIWFVRGNHDRGGGRLLEMMELQEVEPGSRIGAIKIYHHPPEEEEGWLAGHIHPEVRVTSGRITERLRCFWMTKGGLILPAFGAFTGGCSVKPLKEERIFVSAGDRVIEAPASALAAARRRHGMRLSSA